MDRDGYLDQDKLVAPGQVSDDGLRQYRVRDQDLFVADGRANRRSKPDLLDLEPLVIQLCVRYYSATRLSKNYYLIT